VIEFLAQKNRIVGLDKLLNYRIVVNCDKRPRGQSIMHQSKRIRDTVVVLFDEHYVRPICACIGTHLMTCDGFTDANSRPPKRNRPEPDPGTHKSHFSRDDVQQYLSHLSQPESVRDPPMREFSGAPHPMNIAQLPPKFQVWALARTPAPLGPAWPRTDDRSAV
jgi:hypothetical protein